MRWSHSVCATVLAMVLLIGLAVPLVSQTRMDVSKYRSMLEERKGMTSADLIQEFDAGRFKDRIEYDTEGADYLDSVLRKYALTPYEQQLLNKNGFVVTERLSFKNYHDAFYDGYVKDLPVFISADAVLHAFHRTTVNILKDVEKLVVFRRMTEAVLSTLEHLDSMPESPIAEVNQARRDVYVYLAVAGRLLEAGYSEFRMYEYFFEANFSVCYARHNAEVSGIIDLIAAEKPGDITTFTTTPRTIDFSQFKPRSHYAADSVLLWYFKAMTWLGRTEVYLTAPTGVVPPVPAEDVLRQCMMAVELATCASASGAVPNFNHAENVLRRLIGEQDNLTLSSLLNIVANQQVTSKSLLDSTLLHRFQQEALDSGASQQILSQILTDNNTSSQAVPASSFLLMGQRFTLDSYILGNLVHDKVNMRMMPSPLDAAFVLGNDSPIQLMRGEIDRYRYAGDLATLRLLTESLEPEYWNASVYTSWLSAIRGASPPADRSSLPRFMQTTAWWQKALNTQLASWAELRHDFLLYVKQSHTVGLACFYPKGWVEAVPDVYARIGRGAEILLAAITDASYNPPRQDPPRNIGMMRNALVNTARTMNTLESIARKELDGAELDSTEQHLIDEWLMKKGWFPDCALRFNGVYQSLFYNVSDEVGRQETDFIIADVHTQPTDEMGVTVGRVLHVGTGYVNMAIVVAQDPVDGCLTTYVGPVGSYYEHVTEQFTRLSDEEWSALTTGNNTTKTPFARPSWTNVYLANVNGEASGAEVPTLDVIMVSVQESGNGNSGVENMLLAPNPTPGDMLVSFRVPQALAQPVSVQVVDAMGTVIATLSTHIQSEGMYYMRWNGRDAQGNAVPAATYSIVAGSGSSLVVQRAVVVR